jgi:hypothetical protein
MKLLLTLLGLLLVSIAVSGHTENTYRVRSTSGRQTQNILDSNEYVYTHSDDGRAKQLNSFLVDIFETKGNLGDDALVIIRGAMNKFLLTELNAIYEPENNELDAVSSEINEITFLNPGNGNGNGNGNRRVLDGDTKGTELDMTVTLSFDNEPSPSSPELELKVEQIMEDLQYFVTNLTALGVGVNDLSLVTEASRRDYPSESPTQAPVDNTDAATLGNSNSGSNSSSKSNVASRTVASALAGLTLIAGMLYLVFRRKKRSDPESQKGDMMYVDVEGDLYSMDRSLESSQSPTDMNSPPGDHSRYSVPAHPLSPTAGDSVFSGLADSPPSKHTVRTTKSLMSGYTNDSACTIRVSNMDRASKVHAAQKYRSAPAHSSLFAFSEEGYDKYDDSEEEDDLVFGRGGLPHMEKSDLSDDSDVERHLNPEDDAPSPSETSSCLQGTTIEEPTGLLPREKAWRGQTEPSSAEIVQDLALEASANSHAPRDPTPTVSGASKRDPTPRADLPEADKPMVSYSPFNCNPIYPKDAKSSSERNAGAVDEFQTPKASDNNAGTHNSAKVSRKPQGSTPILGDFTPNSQSVYTPGVSSTMETPLQRNTTSTQSSAATSAEARLTSRSSSPAQVQLEWDNDVEAPGTVGAMAAKATTMLGGAFGDGGVTMGSRSRASAMDGGSKPGTPRSSRSAIGSRSTTPNGSRTTTPTKDQSPGSPQGNRLGRHWLRGGIPGMATSPPPGSEDYIDNLSRPSTPGGEFNTSLQGSDYAPEYGCLPFGRLVDRAPKADDPEAEDLEHHGGRRHAGNKLGGDGSAMYQTNAMHPLDWSYKSADIASIGESTISEHDGAAMPSKFIFSRREDRAKTSPGGEPKTPMSESSARTGGTTKGTNESSHSASRQLINDLVWLEKKIADVRHTSSSALVSSGRPAIEATDSLSYVSNDDACISSSSNDSQDDEDPTVCTNKNDSVMSSIVCRDCYAPPGKLHIVIHSTKDGPAVHTVKEGSSLEGHIFPGDLIISVDNVDTRSYTAEQVMKMMAAKGDRERKITVLHFEED